MRFPYHLTSILVTLCTLATSNPTPSDLDLEIRQSTSPTCTDGGTLYCCQATFSGGLAPIIGLSKLLCYDLTPNVVNCIISMGLTFTSFALNHSNRNKPTPQTISMAQAAQGPTAAVK